MNNIGFTDVLTPVSHDDNIEENYIVTIDTNNNNNIIIIIII